MFNSFDDDIQFTYEDEVKSKQPFLDVQLQRNGEGVKLSVNRKSTTNNVYMNFCSRKLKKRKIEKSNWPCVCDMFQ